MEFATLPRIIGCLVQTRHYCTRNISYSSVSKFIYNNFRNHGCGSRKVEGRCKSKLQSTQLLNIQGHEYSTVRCSKTNSIFFSSEKTWNSDNLFLNSNRKILSHSCVFNQQLNEFDKCVYRYTESVRKFSGSPIFFKKSSPKSKFMESRPQRAHVRKNRKIFHLNLEDDFFTYSSQKSKFIETRRQRALSIKRKYEQENKNWNNIYWHLPYDPTVRVVNEKLYEHFKIEVPVVKTAEINSEISDKTVGENIDKRLMIGQVDGDIDSQHDNDNEDGPAVTKNRNTKSHRNKKSKVVKGKKTLSKYSEGSASRENLADSPSNSMTGKIDKDQEEEESTASKNRNSRKPTKKHNLVDLTEKFAEMMEKLKFRNISEDKIVSNWPDRNMDSSLPRKSWRILHEFQCIRSYSLTAMAKTMDHICSVFTTQWMKIIVLLDNTLSRIFNEHAYDDGVYANLGFCCENFNNRDHSFILKCEKDDDKNLSDDSRISTSTQEGGIDFSDLSDAQNDSEAEKVLDGGTSTSSSTEDEDTEDFIDLSSTENDADGSINMMAQDEEIEDFSEPYGTEDEFQNVQPAWIPPIALTRGTQGVFDIDELVVLLKEENARDMCVIKVPPEAQLADYMVIVTGISPRHLSAIAHRINWVYKQKKSRKDPFMHVEGEKTGTWIACDMSNIILHIFMPETREQYDLEMLWSVGPKFDDQSQVQEMNKYMLDKSDSKWLQELVASQTIDENRKRKRKETGAEKRIKYRSQMMNKMTK